MVHNGRELYLIFLYFTSQGMRMMKSRGMAAHRISSHAVHLMHLICLEPRSEYYTGMYHRAASLCMCCLSMIDNCAVSVEAGMLAVIHVPRNDFPAGLVAHHNSMKKNTL